VFGPTQAVPFTEKAVGARFWPVLLALKPNDAVPPGAIDRCHSAPRTLTAAPDCVYVPFHSWVICCPSAKDHVRFQSGIAVVPSFRTVTAAPKPVFQSLCTA
jgi:hypothetical protein